MTKEKTVKEFRPAAKRDPVLTAKDLTFGFGSTPLFEDLSFEVLPGEVLAILGPNGAGKTTLLKCLIGTLKPRQGEVRIGGKPLTEYRVRDLFPKIAYVPQKPGMTLSYTALETVLLGLTGSLGIFSSPGKQEIGKAEQTMEELGILGLRDRPVNELSGGELQLTRIAAAIVKDPELLILDEPESGLDFKNQLLVLDTISGLKTRGVSCIFNTHYPEHAYRRADRGILFTNRERKAGVPSTLYGTMETLITEENIKKSLGVEVVIRNELVENTAVKSVIPIKIALEEETNQ